MTEAEERKELATQQKRKAAGQKTLIIGNYGNYNMGDEAILKSLVFSLLDESDNARIVIPTRNPEFIKTYHGELQENVSATPLFSYGALAKQTIKADKIIIGGGGIWSGYTGRMAKLLPVYMIGSKLIGKRVEVRGIGFYKTAPAHERALVNLGFLFSDSIDVRDLESYNNIWNITKRMKTVTLTADLATKLLNHLDEVRREQYQKEMEEILRDELAACEGKQVIGISIKPMKDRWVNEQVINAFAEYMNAYGRQAADTVFILFPFANTESSIEDDTAMQEELLGHLERPQNVVRMKHTNPLLWLLFMKSKVDIFIGMRFHAVVFSHIAEVPFLAIPYENKVTEYVRDIHHPDVVRPKDITAERLLAFTQQRMT